MIAAGEGLLKKLQPLDNLAGGVDVAACRGDGPGLLARFCRSAGGCPGGGGETDGMMKAKIGSMATFGR